MLSENIRTMRKSKGLSQDELAMKLNVVRQTVSKWERGLSVPDSEMLIFLSETLETPVSILLGEDIVESKVDKLKMISEKLELINFQLAKKKESKRKTIQLILITLFFATLAIFIFLLMINSPYLAWDYMDPETAVLGVIFHAFEWAFVRIAPILLMILIVAIVVTRKKSK